MKRRIWLLSCGMMIGGLLGIMESAIGIGVWRAFGSPNRMFRPWVPAELDFWTLFMTLTGILAGAGFGMAVSAIARRHALEIRFLPLCLRLFLLSAVTYFGAWYLVLRFEIPLWPVDDLVLFLIGLRLARALSIPRVAEASTV